MIMVNQPIDVVIAWVDGNDTSLAEKRSLYLEPSQKSIPLGAQPTRFASINEIKYCVLSILRFAPFVRNIFIVTDGQNPNINDDIRTHYPDRIDSIKIVDHREIFKGFEEFLPTFNSISIGSMVWRIKGLSENFVYFNDDVILIREINPKDWVINNRPVIRGYWRVPPYIKVIKRIIQKAYYVKLLGKTTFEPRFSFHVVQWNAAMRAGMRFRMFFNCHTPHVINRLTVQRFYDQYPNLLKENIAHRFRKQEQFNVTTLANHLEILSGNTNRAKLNLGYLVPTRDSGRRLTKKINVCKTDTLIKSICVQSLDTASSQDQEMIFTWLDSILEQPAILQGSKPKTTEHGN